MQSIAITLDKLFEYDIINISEVYIVTSTRRGKMMYATTDRQLNGSRNSNGDSIALVQSGSNPNKFYRVDVTNGRCNCPAWIHQKVARKPCKHLRALGFTQVVLMDAVAEPTSKVSVEKNHVTEVL